MADVMKVLREEIARLARREIKKTVADLRKDNARLRKQMAALKSELQSVRKVSSQASKTIKKSGIAAAVQEKTQESAAGSRMRHTASSISKMRQKLGVTQAEFGKLLGVSGQSVFQWEHATKPLRLRNATKAALASLRGVGKREASKMLDAPAPKAKAAKPAKAKKAKVAKKAAKPAKKAKAGRKPRKAKAVKAK